MPKREIMPGEPVFNFESLLNIDETLYKFNRRDYVIWQCPNHNKGRIWSIQSMSENEGKKTCSLESVACLGDTSTCGKNCHTSHMHMSDIDEEELTLYDGDECEMISEILDDFAWDGTAKHIQEFLFNHVLKFIKPANNLKWGPSGDNYVLSTKCSLMKGITWTISKHE